MSFVALSPEGSTHSASHSQRVVPNGQSIRLALRASMVITGSVLDASGNPLVRVRVEATARKGAGGMAAFTDENGRFALRVPAGETYTVDASLKNAFGDYKQVVQENVTGGDVVLRFR
jgi:hypothetical protein